MESLERLKVAEGCLVVALRVFPPVVHAAEIFATIETKVQSALVVEADEEVDAVAAAHDELLALGAVCRVVDIDLRHGQIARVHLGLNLLLLELLCLRVERPAGRIVVEVVVRVRHRQDRTALPAELCVAVLTRHFVAAFCFLDWEVAHRTPLRAVLDVQQVQSLLDKIFRSSDACRVFVQVQRGLLTAFERVPLLGAERAELEHADRTLTHAFVFVNLGRLAAPNVRAPAEVYHLIDCFAD